MEFFPRVATLIRLTHLDLVPDGECSKSDLTRSRARGKGALPSSLNKGKKVPAHVSSCISRSKSKGINNVTETGDRSNDGEAEDVGSDTDVDLHLDLGLQRAPVNHNGFYGDKLLRVQLRLPIDLLAGKYWD